MRFAIWTAVSTTAQATEDKTSLAEQERKCRKIAEAKGWTESAGPFVVPGESRSRWVNLRDAEEEMPSLRHMLETAKEGRFDVLILYDYNRLRDLLDPIAKTLATYGVQIYSTNQPVEPLSPQEFNPYAADSASMMQGMSQIISRWQIADLRRKYFYGSTARVKRGLPAFKIPYGYRRPPGREQDRKAVPIQIPEECRIIKEIKELYLSGCSTYQIRETLEGKGYPSPSGGKTWHRKIVQYILLNPFYAGKVFFGRNRHINDPHNQTSRRVPNPNVILADGKHEPVYSWEDYQAILAEHEHRKKNPITTRHAFSGLLRCSVCNSRLIHNTGFWRCRYPGTDHIGLKVVEANYVIGHALKNVILEKKDFIHEPLTQPEPDREERTKTLQAQRKEIQRAFERGIYTMDEAEQRIQGIEKQIAAIQDESTRKARSKGQRAQFMLALEMLEEMGEKVTEWIYKDDPKVIRSFLYRLCKDIIISPNRDVRIVLRD